MGLGRQVADAYIEVHGDLSKFRKDLEGADDKALQKRAMEDADTFAEAWGQRMQDKVLERWHSTIDALASDKAFDWDRMIGSFDAKNFDDAAEKISTFMNEMHTLGKLTDDEFIKMDDAIKGQLENIKERSRLEEEHTKLLQDQAAELKDIKRLEDAMAENAKKAGEIRKRLEEEAWTEEKARNARRAKTMEDAIKENERWARTFEGISKNHAIEKLNEDFTKLGKIMGEADFDKFAKGFRSYDELQARVEAVTDAMKTQNRISDEGADALNARMREYIGNANEQIRLIDEQKRLDAEAKGEALTNARLLREEQERYNRSLEGMLRTSAYQKQERDFRMLTDAINSGDWSKIGNGARDMRDFRDHTQRAVFHLREVGRISDEEFTRISNKVTEVSTDLERYNVHLREGRDTVRDTGNHWRVVGDRIVSLGRKFEGTFSHLKGLAGVNVFGDMIREGLHFAQNVDRIAVGLARTAIFAGAVTSALSAGIGGMVVVAGDLAKAANIAILAPAFLTGLGIMVGVAVAALKDMKTRLGDLKPAFQELQNSISDAFWKQAEQPIRNLVDSLMPTLKEQLKNTATSMGGLFQAFADGIRKSATPAKVEGMFKKMNASIDIAKGAMGPLTNAFVTLGEHGANYFGRFAHWIVGLSTDFDKFITKASKDGRLKKWTEEAIDAFKNTGRAIGGITEIFQGINDAAEKAGIGGLKEFADVLERTADNVKSPAFQKTLTTFFEGALLSLGHIKAGIADLGPAFESVMPSVKYVLDNLGAAAGALISDLATIIADPDFQKGLRDFSQGIRDAVELLKPALGPLADSIGNMGTIIGEEILPNVAKLVTAFTVDLGPIIDDMGTKMAGLATPLQETMVGAIKTLKPVLETLNTAVVGPLVVAIRDHLLPAIDSFVREAGPFLQGVAEAVGPVFETLVGTTLPAVLKFAQTLFKPVGALFDLMTPALRDIVAGIGTSFDSLATAMEDFNNWADPAYKAMDKVRESAEKMDKFKLSKDSSPVADLIAKYTFSAIASDPVVASFATFFGKLSAGWTSSLSGFIKFLTDPKTYIATAAATMAANLPSWMFEGFKIEDFAVAVGTWLHENIYVPLKDAWATFLVKLALIFVGGGEGGATSEGGGSPMGGMAVGAKIMPQMIDSEAEKSFLDTFIAGVTEKIGGWGALIGASFTTWQAGTKAQWDGFWGSLPGAAEGGMGQSSAKVATHTVAMGFSLGAFVAANAPKWAGFFATAQQQASTSMGAAAVTVAGKTIAMTGSINTWATTNRATWLGTLAGMATNAVTYWNSMSGTTTSKLATMVVTTAAKTGAMKTSAGTSLAGMAALFVQHFITAKTEVAGSLGTIVGKFAGLAGRITSALSGLKGTLSSIGGDAMDGFKAGIDSRAGLIASAAAAVVAGAIAAAREAQKSNSPSKVYRSLGWDAGDGYALGFGDSESPVQKAAAALMDSAIGAFAKSKMYIAGADAALGLAAGLQDNKSVIDNVFADILPNTVALSGLKVTGTGDTAAPVVQHITNIEAGAIPITTPTQDPEQVASKTIDAFAGYSKF